MDKKEKAVRKSAHNRTSILLIAISALMIIAAIIFAVGGAFGWFTDDRKNESTASVIPLQVTTQVYFLQDDGSKLIADNNTGLINITLNNQSAATALERLRVTVTVQGNRDFAYRLLVYHIWQKDGESPSQANINFKHDPKLYNNMLLDGAYWYYDNSATGSNLAPFTLNHTSPYTFEAITGVDGATRFESGLSLQMSFVSNVVQINRIYDIWGENCLPVIS